MVLRAATSLLESLEGVAPENRDFWALKWHERSPKKSRFSGPTPSNAPRTMKNYNKLIFLGHAHGRKSFRKICGPGKEPSLLIRPNRLYIFFAVKEIKEFIWFLFYYILNIFQLSDHDKKLCILTGTCAVYCNLCTELSVLFMFVGFAKRKSQTEVVPSPRTLLEI